MSGIIEELGLDKMSEQLETKKDVYQIWREYLKRSELYKKGCDWVKTLPHNPATKLSDFEYMDNLGGVKAREVIGEFMREVRNPFAIDKDSAICTTKKAIKQMLMQYYCFFGDVYSESFDFFWQRAIAILIELNIFDIFRENSTPAVFPIKGMIDKEILTEIKETVISKLKREPTLDEFIDLVEAAFDESEAGLMLVAVVLSRPLYDIQTDIKEIVKEERKKQGISVTRSYYNNCLPTQPVENIDVKSHQRYLEVYDLKIVKAKKLKEVVLHFHPEMNPEIDIDWSSTERMYKADLQKARRILKNVEDGQFPGRINGFK